MPRGSCFDGHNNQPIHPYDFQSGERFKCGTTNTDPVQNLHDRSRGRHTDALIRGRLKSNEAWASPTTCELCRSLIRAPELQLWESSPEGAQLVKADESVEHQQAQGSTKRLRSEQFRSVRRNRTMKGPKSNHGDSGWFHHDDDDLRQDRQNGGVSGA